MNASGRRGKLWLLGVLLLFTASIGYVSLSFYPSHDAIEKENVLLKEYSQRIQDLLKDTIEQEQAISEDYKSATEVIKDVRTGFDSKQDASKRDVVVDTVGHKAETKEPTMKVEPIRTRSSEATTSASTDSGTAQRPEKESNGRFFEGATAILMLCYKRPAYLRKSLQSVYDRITPLGPENHSIMSIYISQDGNDREVKRVVDEFVNRFQKHGFRAEHWEHPRTNLRRGESNYHKLASHYKWALDRVFDGNLVQASRVIILEDDMELAVDFFEYMGAMSTLLDKDETIMAVSAWNDQGQSHLVSDPAVVVRSDFFPGLGWMMPKRIWDELGPQWPEAYWDDWIRNPLRRKGRQFIRPEICRTYTFGEMGGASSGQFYRQYLQPIKLNTEPVAFREMDLDFLLPENFEKRWTDMVTQAVVVKSAEDIEKLIPEKASFIIECRGEFELKQTAFHFRFMPDCKADVPRGAYHGTIPLRYKGYPLFIHFIPTPKR